MKTIAFVLVCMATTAQSEPLCYESFSVCGSDDVGDGGEECDSCSDSDDDGDGDGETNACKGEPGFLIGGTCELHVKMGKPGINEQFEVSTFIESVVALPYCNGNACATVNTRRQASRDPRFPTRRRTPQGECGNIADQGLLLPTASLTNVCQDFFDYDSNDFYFPTLKDSEMTEAIFMALELNFGRLDIVPNAVTTVVCINALKASCLYPLRR